MDAKEAKAILAGFVRSDEHLRLRDFENLDWPNVTDLRRRYDLGEVHLSDGWRVCAVYLPGPDPAAGVTDAGR